MTPIERQRSRQYPIEKTAREAEKAVASLPRRLEADFSCQKRQSAIM
jgi:hypothetical protein